MAEELSLGGLSYDITAKFDQITRDLESFEAKWNNRILMWKLEIDTTGAEAKLTAIANGAGSVGAGAGGWAGSAATVSRPVGGGDMWGGGRGIAGGRGGSQSLRAINAAYADEAAGIEGSLSDDDGALANVTNITNNRIYNRTGGGGGGGGPREPRSDNRGFGFIRPLAGIYIAARGAEALYQAEQEENQMDDILARGQNTTQSAGRIYKEQAAGFTGMSRAGVSWAAGEAAGFFGQGSLGGSIFGGLSDRFDVNQHVRDNEKNQDAEERKIKEERASLQLRHFGDKLDDQLEAASDTLNEEQGGAGAKITKLRVAYQKTVDAIGKEVEAAEHAAAEFPTEQVQKRLAHVKETQASINGAAEAILNFGIQEVGDDAADRSAILDFQHDAAYGSVAQRAKSHIDFINRQAGQKLKNLDQDDPEFANVIKETRNDIAKVQRAASIDFITGQQATADRIRELGIETAAEGRGSKMAGAFGRVADIVDTANRQEGIFKTEGDMARAKQADQLGIAQLQNLQAKLLKGGDSQEVDPTTTYLGSRPAGGSDDIPQLLRDIAKAIADLQIRIGAVN